LKPEDKGDDQEGEEQQQQSDVIKFKTSKIE
jgi:hypothetical protein